MGERERERERERETRLRPIETAIQKCDISSKIRAKNGKKSVKY